MSAYSTITISRKQAVTMLAEYYSKRLVTLCTEDDEELERLLEDAHIGEVELNNYRIEQ